MQTISDFCVPSCVVVRIMLGVTQSPGSVHVSLAGRGSSVRKVSYLCCDLRKPDFSFYRKIKQIRYQCSCHTFTNQPRIACVSMRISIRRDLRRILFKRRMFNVRVTFLLRSCGVLKTYLYSYGISLSYARRVCFNVYSKSMF